MSKLTVCDLIADKVNEEINERGTKAKIDMCCLSYEDELIFVMLDEHYKWRDCRIKKKKCEKLFNETYINEGSYLDVLIEMAKGL